VQGWGREPLLHRGTAASAVTRLEPVAYDQGHDGRDSEKLVKDERVRAAGGVIERTRDGHREILLVHRPRYDDWTLPKGKARRDESDEACALREVEEETGLICELHGEVAVSEYEDAAGRPKRVRYFAMTPHDESNARAQNEVDAFAWLSYTRAIEQLSYGRDKELVSSLPSSSRRP
jgi:8-oxo-dGTP pyrophosphatase MutT (NUDIX family)